MNIDQKARFSAALQRVAGDEEMLGMMAKIAAEDAPAIMDDLETQVQEERLPDAAKTAHKLKGVLGTFETGEPVNEIQAMIEFARQGNLAKVQKMHSELSPKLQVLLTEINAIAA